MTNAEIRQAVLRAVYDMHHERVLPKWSGDVVSRLPRTPGPSVDLATVDAAIDYLVERKLVQTRPAPGLGAGGGPKHLVQSILAAGIDEIDHPARERAPTHTHNNFNGPVGSVQMGDHNSAHVTQHIGSSFEDLITALEQIRSSTEGSPETEEVAQLATSAIKEIKRGNGFSDRLKAVLLSLAYAFPALGAIHPSYEDVRAISATYGCILPAFPTSSEAMTQTTQQKH
jgi:hypothetical protein